MHKINCQKEADLCSFFFFSSILCLFFLQIPLVKQSCPASTKSKRERSSSVSHTDYTSTHPFRVSHQLSVSFIERAGQYLPSCNEDGYYRSHQCHSSSGQCWCVDRYGNEVAGSRTHGPADCGRQARRIMPLFRQLF